MVIYRVPRFLLGHLHLLLGRVLVLLGFHHLVHYFQVGSHHQCLLHFLCVSVQSVFEVVMVVLGFVVHWL